MPESFVQGQFPHCTFPYDGRVRVPSCPAPAPADWPGCLRRCELRRGMWRLVAGCFLWWWSPTCHD